jgi:hypothetical protein
VGGCGTWARRAGLERAGGAPARPLGVDQHGDSKAPRVGDLVVARRVPRGMVWRGRCGQGAAQAKVARGSGVRSAGGAGAEREARGATARRLRADPPREQWSRAWRMSEAIEEKAADEVRRHYELLMEDMEVTWCKQTTALAEVEVASMAWQARKEQLRSGEAVGAGAARRGSDARHRTDGWLGSIPQASARAGQQATREQVEGQWCESRTGTARRRCDQARRSCRRLRGCAGHVSAAHAREQRRLSP